MNNYEENIKPRSGAGSPPEGQRIMSKCEHDFEYGQEPGDFEMNAWQKRCIKCGYQTYMITRPGL